MHKFGITCLVFVVGLALGGLWFTAKLYKARAYYVKLKLQDEQKMEKDAREIAELRRKVVGTQRELTHTLLGWNPYWNDVPVRIFQQNNILEVGIGTAHGLSPSGDPDDQTKQQVVFCFQPDENGEFIYVGDFRVVNVENDVATLTPNWNVSPDESAAWNSEGNWRIRALIPSHYQVRYNGLELQDTSLRELLASKESDLKKQQNLLAIATERRDQRIAEIDGPGDGAADLMQKLKSNLPANAAGAGQDAPADPQNRPREDVVGLLLALEEAEEVRNNIVGEADRLRRELLQTLTDFERIQAENLQLVNSMSNEAVNVQRTQESAESPSAVTSR